MKGDGIIHLSLPYNMSTKLGNSFFTSTSSEYNISVQDTYLQTEKGTRVLTKLGKLFEDDC